MRDFLLIIELNRKVAPTLCMYNSLQALLLTIAFMVQIVLTALLTTTHSFFLSW